jgi:RimJ/RimL family protein N-acetyltransferase
MSYSRALCEHAHMAPSASAVVVRPMEPADVGAAVDLYAAVAAEGIYIGGETPVDKDERCKRWTENLARDDLLSLVAEADGRIVGLAGLEGLGTAELGMLVAADWRRQGVGTLLMEGCVGWARRRGAHKITLQVWPHNEGARRFYERFGFVQEGYLRKHYRRRSGELWDSVVMGLLLVED